MIGHVAPHIVQVAVASRAGGIVTFTTEQPELTVLVDPGGGVAATARSPDIVGFIAAQLIAVDSVRTAGVRALDPSPSAGLGGRRIGSVDPKIVESSVAVGRGRVTTKEPEISSLIDPSIGTPARAWKITLMETGEQRILLPETRPTLRPQVLAAPVVLTGPTTVCEA